MTDLRGVGLLEVTMTAPPNTHTTQPRAKSFKSFIVAKAFKSFVSLHDGSVRPPPGVGMLAKHTYWVDGEEQAPRAEALRTKKTVSLAFTVEGRQGVAPEPSDRANFWGGVCKCCQKWIS